MELLECILLKQQHLLDSQEFEANRGNNTEASKWAFAYHQLEELKEWYECGGPNDQESAATTLLPVVSGCNYDLTTILLDFYKYYRTKYNEPGSFNSESLVKSYIQKELKNLKPDEKQCEQWYHKHLNILCGDKYCRVCGKDLRKL